MRFSYVNRNEIEVNETADQYPLTTDFWMWITKDA